MTLWKFWGKGKAQVPRKYWEKDVGSVGRAEDLMNCVLLLRANGVLWLLLWWLALNDNMFRMYSRIFIIFTFFFHLIHFICGFGNILLLYLSLYMPSCMSVRINWWKMCEIDVWREGFSQTIVIKFIFRFSRQFPRNGFPIGNVLRWSIISLWKSSFYPQPHSDKVNTSGVELQQPPISHYSQFQHEIQHIEKDDNPIWNGRQKTYENKILSSKLNLESAQTKKLEKENVELFRKMYPWNTRFSSPALSPCPASDTIAKNIHLFIFTSFQKLYLPKTLLLLLFPSSCHFASRFVVVFVFPSPLTRGLIHQGNTLFRTFITILLRHTHCRCGTMGLWAGKWYVHVSFGAGRGILDKSLEHNLLTLEGRHCGKIIH